MESRMAQLPSSEDLLEDADLNGRLEIARSVAVLGDGRGDTH